MKNWTQKKRIYESNETLSGSSLMVHLEIDGKLATIRVGDGSKLRATNVSKGEIVDIIALLGDIVAKMDKAKDDEN